MSNRGSIRVLHVDDEPDFAELTAQMLERKDDRFSVETATSASEGLDRLAEDEFDCVVSDYDMPRMDGIDFLNEITEAYPDLPFLLFTGKGSEEVASEAISAGVTDYLQKKPGTEQYELLANRIGNVVVQSRSRQQLQSQRHQLEQLHEATRKLMTAETRTEIAERASATARDILDLPLNGIHFYDPDRGGLVPVAVTDEVNEIFGTPPVIGPSDGVAWTAYKTGDAQIYGDIREAAEVMNTDTPIRSEIHIPLGEHGVLIAASTTPDDFTESEITSIKILAANVETALNRAEREQELEQANAVLRTIAENTNDVLWQFNDDWTDLRFINSAYEEIWGRPTDELHDQPRSFLTGVHPEDRPAVEDAMKQVSAGDSVDLEFQVNAAEDFQRWVWVQGNPVFDDAGEVETVVGFARDVTERKERERELERYEAIVVSSDDGIYVFDADGRFEFVNQRVVDVSGIPMEGWIGEHVSIHTDLETLSEEEVAAIEAGIEDIVDGTENEVRVELTPDVPHDLRDLELRLTPFDTESGTERVIGFSRDITERKDQQRELRRKNARLEEFASVVSHDLRNPLNVAHSRLELAREECDSAHLADAAKAVDRSLTLIEDLLTLAREGQPVSEPGAVALGDIVDRCWGTVETADATVDIESDLTIEADSSRLQQLLENLFRNAVEHAGEDVTVTVGQLDDRGGFYVADDGPGIHAEERDEVFEAGYSTTDEGTGFGLNIVQEIAEAHDWEITVSDSEADGARFEITGVDTAER